MKFTPLSVWPAVLALGGGLAGFRVAAQDITVGKPLWFLDGPAPADLPQLPTRIHPESPASMKEATDVGYGVFIYEIDAGGKNRLSSQPMATHPPLRQMLETFFGRDGWNPKPATRDGQSVATRLWIATLFNPRSAPEKGADATPRLLAVAPAVTPTKLAADGVPLLVRMRLALDETGAITDTAPVDTIPSGVLEAIHTSLKSWRFAPARKGGQAVAAELVVPVLCESPTAAPEDNIAPPKAVSQEKPVYPFAMRRFGLRGSVLLEFEVNTQGRVQNARIVSSDNPAFDEPALKAVFAWKFEPATRNGQPVTMRMRVPIQFTLEGYRDGGQSALTISQHGDQSGLPPEMRFDTPPQFRGVVVPIYPYEQRRDRVSGKARGTVLIDQQGRVAAVKIAKADQPEFGLALTAALEGFLFEPALKGGNPVATLMNFEQSFSSTELPDESADKLLALEKRHPDQIISAAGLDKPLKPISQRAAVFPKSLAGKTAQGEALLEILINEEGHVILPRIVSASDPAFGYAAVQSVSAWWFEPPKAGGKPVVVRVRVPFSFGPKTPQAPAGPRAAPGPATP